ncbi:hypothetical protein IJ23_03390 [Vibrio sp. OY15]|nr:hypothetical protein [Vibrio alginolyticus]KFJ89475.1 hypothetical protein IJ23_03390 [Vibrio sp. OY15]
MQECMEWSNLFVSIGWAVLQACFSIFSFLCLTGFVKHNPIKPKYAWLQYIYGPLLFLTWGVMLVTPMMSAYIFFSVAGKSVVWLPALKMFGYWWVAFGVFCFLSSVDERLRSRGLN